MSNALAMSAVTAVLQYFLNLVYNNPEAPFGSVSVTAIAPDIIQISSSGGPSSTLQVNLFLHQVTHNAAWRNVGMPSLGADGTTPLTNPPLALDLHYLMTAYASQDSEAEGLLGYGILFLHENGILRRGQIRAALSAIPPSNPLSTVLGTSGLADQIELIKVTPATLGKEEMAWLWTALKADYRPTYPFQASVVLIDPQLPVSLALPVLSRNLTVKPGPPPQLFQVQPPSNQAAAAPGDTVSLTGQSLVGASAVVLVNPRLGIQYPPITPASVTNTQVSFVAPDDPANLPAGVYSVRVVFENGGVVVQSTNSLAIALAPTILAAPAPTAVANLSGTLVTLHCDPQVLPNQSVSLALASTSVPAQPFTAQTDTPSFQFPTLAHGAYLARLRVDGVDSPVSVNWTPPPPTFAGPFVNV